MNFITLPETTFIRFVKRHWLTIAFLLGFLTDLILLNRVDDAIDNLVLFMYASLASLSLVLFYVAIAEKAPTRIISFLHTFMPVVMQYSFGGLLSGMLIFYGRSGDFLVSAPFLALIILVMFLLLKVLSRIIPHFIALEKRMIVFVIGSLYMLFNAFYFLNIIPPIPLSLTELSIYQHVERTTFGGYRIEK